MTYSQKLRDPRWQQVRLRVFERDGWECQRQDCSSPANTTLIVHHKRYEPGREPWEYPLENFETLCENCHERTHEGMKPSNALNQGTLYKWSELPRVLGFEPRGFLTQLAGKIMCGCFRLDLNPGAPDVVLPGDEPRIADLGRRFSQQREFIPIFIKAADADWEGVLRALSGEIDQHGSRRNRRRACARGKQRCAHLHGSQPGKGTRSRPFAGTGPLRW